ncbi:very short patch repair endonuclease [Macellibacteroides fermentans]|uniref:very short patch repair endonuclease n=1 Tax=Macellibacteroides fermentans TaxID=879969 RepID=UPI0015CC27AE|nr:DNA mismatch endonuclease Vsr [Macellibacteroides fermentans]MBP6663428.1 DNA mismatch endonuclease Vsr [Paludibacter sp.]MBP7839811.1 DNA mismatch endonuclease Vsr [Bacteroidales bacterium]MBP7920002.1 DNA mismatch endonuclease Vsr [Parabacteroides sp.]
MESAQRTLYRQGFRFRKNVKDLPGKPDIVLHKYKTIIFVHGCFWHGHTCKRGTLPKTNQEFWVEKIVRNTKRDNNNICQLRKKGWNVIIVWQCEIRSIKNREIRLERLFKEITEPSPSHQCY